ncbi:TPA: DUF5462 family protein [Salmonella enterica]|nr:DUF5462 family protein [Salmonella enterica]
MKNGLLCGRSVLAVLVALTLGGGDVRAEDELDMSFIQGGSGMDREAWAALNSNYAPGRYLVDLSLNEKEMGKYVLDVTPQDSEALCLSDVWLTKAGVYLKVDYFKAGYDAARQCHVLTKGGAVKVDFDVAAQSLMLSVPQAGLSVRPENTEWDYGASALREQVYTAGGTMVLNNRKAAMAGILITVLAVACPQAAAKDIEKMQHLGVVNGQVKDNQVVEMTRTLTDPVLYKVDSPESLPQTLRIRNATVRVGDNGAVWLTVSQRLPGAKQQSSAVTTRSTLWVDGKVVLVTCRQQGEDVLVSPGRGATPQQQVMLRSDSPVVLQVPATWRGPVEVMMEINGEE